MFSWLRNRKLRRPHVDADDRRAAALDEATAWAEGHAMQHPACHSRLAVWGPIYEDEQRSFSVGCRFHRSHFDYFIES